MENKITIQTLHRLPKYLNILKEQRKLGAVNISAKTIADELGLVEIQVRKDLASVSSGGKPKIGYNLSDLIDDVETSLGYNNMNDAVLIGAGKLGKALMDYEGFKDYGLNIVAAFDNDSSKHELTENGKEIFSLEKLPDLCRRMCIYIGIITVPAEYAQEVCDLLVASGIKAIWNFAPANLKAPGDILIQNENMAVSLALLSKHLTEKKLKSE